MDKTHEVFLSIIVPCYNEEEALPLFYKEIKKTLSALETSYELLFVDDGSDDKTLSVIKSFVKVDACVKFYSFSRNFGKEAAIYAGFCNAKGQYVAVMDADLQDPPSLLPEMISILQQGEYDSVATRRISRTGEPRLRSFFAKLFYKIINRVSDADIVDGARDFRLMTRKMADAVVAMGEYNRFSKGIFGWIGFKTYWLPYENTERVAGKTKWNFRKLFWYAIDGFVNFSEAPLNIAFSFGTVMTLVSFVFLIFIFVRKLIFGDPVDGWASTICIMLFLGSVQLLCISITGKYVAKTYMETKKRPHYIIAESNSNDTKIMR